MSLQRIDVDPRKTVAGVVRLLRRAAELVWLVLDIDGVGSDSPSWLNPMEPLRVVGEAIGRSVTAGHWPAWGPTDEHLSQIADNLSRARHLVGQDGRPTQSAISEVEADIQHRGQVWTHAAVAASLNQVNPQRAGVKGERGEPTVARRPCP